jgi:hypothetical protein
MAAKKKYQNSDEIDFSEIFKKWWSFRKPIFVRTIIVSLIITFILVISDKAYHNKSLQYVTAVIKSDLGEKSSLIISAYKSRPHITKTLKKLSLNIDPNELIENLIIKESTDPSNK